MLAYFHSWTSWFLLHSGVLVWEPMRQIIKSVRLGTRSRLWFVVGLLRVLLIKQTFRNWLISITSAKQRSSVLTDVEKTEQSLSDGPYQMVHVRINCWRHKAVLSCTKWLQKASTVLCSTDKSFLATYRLTFHKEMPITQAQKLFWYCTIFSEILLEKNIHTHSLLSKIYVIWK